MKEAETRAEHIDHNLEAAGWGVVEPVDPVLIGTVFAGFQKCIYQRAA